MFNYRSSCPVLVTTLSPNRHGHVAASQGVLPYLLGFFNHVFFNHSFVVKTCSSTLV